MIIAVIFAANILFCQALSFSSSSNRNQYIIYTAQKGDSLIGVARSYQISLKKLCQANNFSYHHKLKIGEKLLIPRNTSIICQWPLKGKISFKNKGIDIEAEKSIIIYPFARGKVDFADNIHGYGYTVIMHHKNDLASVYSNLTKLYVKEGQWVSIKQPLGEIGRNVHSGEAYLHFEIRKKGRAVNPLSFLQ